MRSGLLYKSNVVPLQFPYTINSYMRRSASAIVVTFVIKSCLMQCRSGYYKIQDKECLIIGCGRRRATALENLEKPSRSLMKIRKLF